MFPRRTPPSAPISRARRSSITVSGTSDDLLCVSESKTISTAARLTGIAFISRTLFPAHAASLSSRKGSCGTFCTIASRSTSPFRRA